MGKNIRHPKDCGAIVSCVEQVNLNEEDMIEECI
jgi:hypothetical protein